MKGGNKRKMFKIYDGRETFYQWDINQKLIVADDSITEVHFSNRTNNYSLVCDIQNEGDLRVVFVPNVLLQTNLPIKVYAYRKDHTEVSETFKVIEKDKPEDYVYTPDEVKTWEELNDRVTALEKPAESVLYTAQELTEEQKAQARQNIGSFDIFDLPNLIKFDVKSKAIFGDKIVEGQVFALNDFQPIDINTADAETIEAWRIVYNYFSLKPMQKFVSNISALQALALLIDKNMLGENFYSTHDYLNPALFGRNKKFIKVYSYYSNDAEKKAIAGFIYDLEQSLGQFTYNVLTNTIEYYNYSYPLTVAAATSTDGKELISQTNMRADPTNDMEIATKHYVDNAPIKQASVTELGGIKVGTGLAIADDGTLSFNSASAAGLTPVSYSCTDGTYSVSDTVYLESGNIISPTDTVSNDVRLAFRWINFWGIPAPLDSWKNDIKKYKLLIDNGYLENNTIWYSKPDKKLKKQIRFGTHSTLGNYIIFNFNYDYEVIGQLVYYVDTDTISTGTDTYLNYSLKRDKNNVLSYSAIKLASDPTEPMQIATKQYVDNSIAASGTDISLGLTSASVGQTIKVKAVDESGKPTEWEVADMPTGEEDFELIFSDTITEDANGFVRTVDKDGNPFELKEAVVIVYTVPFETATSDVGRGVGFLPSTVWGHDTPSSISNSIPAGTSNIARYDVLHVKVVQGYQCLIDRWGSQNSTNVRGIMMKINIAGQVPINFKYGDNVTAIGELSNSQGNMTCLKIVSYGTSMAKGDVVILYGKRV